MEDNFQIKEIDQQPIYPQQTQQPKKRRADFSVQQKKSTQNHHWDNRNSAFDCCWCDYSRPSFFQSREYRSDHYLSAGHRFGQGNYSDNQIPKQQSG